MGSIVIVGKANSLAVNLVPLRNTGSTGYVSPAMPQEEGVEIEPHN